MKLLIIAILTMTNGASLEIIAPSLERCAAWQASVKAGARMEITDEGGIKETVLSIDCKPTEVNAPDVEGQDV